jgi:REP element-mobilizing transposase RayT
MKTKGYETTAYVIMPNHVHVILCFPEMDYDINKIISNAKRLIAYEIVKRLKQENHYGILDHLSKGVSIRERHKGSLYKVFNDSFDAKGIYSEWFLQQKLNYIHLNPVRGKWKLVNDYTDYEHSSASYYERGVEKMFVPFDYRLF